jgi:hypothetical protein
VAFYAAEHFIAMKHIKTVVFMAAMFMLPFLSGCVTPVSPEAESDWNWKQMNPNWKPTIPADSAAQQERLW